MAPSIPKMHKAAMFKEKGGPLVVEEIETPQPGPGEVLVKVHAVGVCHSDGMVQAQAMGVPLYVISIQRRGYSLEFWAKSSSAP